MSARVRLAGAACAGFLLLPILLLGLGCSSRSEQGLVRQFIRQRGTFEELCQMARADSDVTLVRSDLFIGRSGRRVPGRDKLDIGDARYEQYLRLFRSLGLSGGFVRSKSGIMFVAQQGSVTSPATLGFLYSKDTPEPLTDRVESYSPFTRSGERQQPTLLVYRRLDADWYIFKFID